MRLYFRWKLFVRSSKIASSIQLSLLAKAAPAIEGFNLAGDSLRR